MEVVYILSNDAVELAQLIQLGKGEVGLVRLGIGGQPPFLKYLPPFFSGFGAAYEFLVGEVVGVKSCSDSPGAAKIGDA